MWFYHGRLEVYFNTTFFIINWKFVAVSIMLMMQENVRYNISSID